MSGYEWRACRRGDPLPPRAVLAGKTSADGPNFVCRVNNECGKVNIDGAKLYNFWCHGSGKNESGDVLCVLEGYAATWVHKKKGDPIPDGVVLAGATPADGDNYACRHDGGAGKVNVDGGRLYNFWIHGNWVAKHDGDVCCILPVGGDRHENLDAGSAGVRSEAWWDDRADCDGIPARDRAMWLMDDEGYTLHAARLRVKSDFSEAFTDVRGGGDFVNHGSLPHCLSVVDTPSGPRLTFHVVCNAADVGRVTISYQINGGDYQTVDIRQPDGGSQTYTHTTADGGVYPFCRDCDRVSYWLAAEIGGSLEEVPDGAAANHQRRMHWVAHH